jgi:hypothetical protein
MRGERPGVFSTSSCSAGLAQVSRFSIIRDASVALRARVFEALGDSGDVDFGFTNIDTDIILSAPDSDIPENARLSVYLYHLMPDAQLRNQLPIRDGTDGLRRAPIALQQNYLITPLGNDEPENQLILGRIIQALHDSPFIDRIAGAPLDDSLGSGSPQFRLSIEPMSLEEISRIWYAMGSDYRLSVAYAMRSVMIDSALDPRRGPPVRESHILVGTKG